MMSKWDTIQADLAPITPKYWGDEAELENETISLDEILEAEEKELAELENEQTNYQRGSVVNVGGMR